MVNGNPVNDIIKSYYFENYANDETNLITLKFNGQIDSCSNMFNGMSNIVEIDLSNFDFSTIIDMENMFIDCINLKKIKFGNIDSSSVRNMMGLFKNCIKLESLDLSKFDTSSVTTMKEMFSHCESMIVFNLSNFNTLNLEIMYDMFAYCSNLISIDLSPLDTRKVINMRGIFFNCTNLVYLDMPNFYGDNVNEIIYTFSGCKKLIYLNLRNFKTTRSELSHEWIFRDTPDYLKICISDSHTKNLFSSEGKKIDCTDMCFNTNINFKVDLDQHKCSEICEYFEYDNYCYITCPQGTYPIEGENLCLSSKPEGYYLDSGKYKKCYISCKSCNSEGNEINHNCDECISGFKFLSEFNKNCYENCKNYYYFDNQNNYYCIDKNECLKKYYKLIEDKNKCIDECYNDNTYNYKY